MIQVEEYIQQTGTPRRTAFRKIASGEIPSVFVNGRRIVIQKIPSLSNKEKKTIIKSVRAECDAMILSADLNDKAETVSRVEEKIKYWNAQGIVIKGYNPKSIYRKIGKAKAHGKLQRRTRADKGAIKNELLKNNFERIAEVAAKVYLQNAQPNLNLTVDLIQQFARENEEYYELAAISRFTLYRQLRQHWKESGKKTLHEFLNRNNKFRKSLPTVRGAFTDDIGFMDYIVIDDHKHDVATVKVYNELSGKVEEKQVQSWECSEAKTMKPLGWITKVGEFTAADLIKLVSQVVMQYGLPKDNLMLDNGLGRSEEFKNFWRKLSGKEPHYSIAYSPNGKATRERAFRIEKDEFDSFQKNYVAPHKEDSRHTTAALSAEKGELFFDEYKEKFEAYLTGFFQSRPRTLNGKKTRISIAEYFNQFWQQHEKKEITAQQLRYAISKAEVKKYNNKIKIGRDEFIPLSPLPVSFNAQSFIILRTPFDKSEIDLYALEYTVDRVSGEIWDKNQFIATLYNTRLHPEKRALVAKLKKSINKNLRAMAQDVAAMKQLQSPTPDTVGTNGELIEERKQNIQKTIIAMKSQLDKLPEDISLNEQKDETAEESEAETIQLTYISEE